MKNILFLLFAVALCLSVKAQRSPKEAYDTFPRFSEYSDDFNNYIADHVQKPVSISIDEKISIGITVQVDSNGKSSILNITPKPSPEVTAEFVKVINAAPKWRSAKLKNKPVNYFFTTFFDIDVNKATSTMKVEVHGQPKQPVDPKGTVYTRVEVNPSFPGGPKAFSEFLNKNIHYPAEAHQKNLQGNVYVQFVVEPDGSLNDIKVLRDVGGGCGDEAIRVLKTSPKWIPGTQGGVAVRVQFTVPISFKLN